MAKTRWNKKRYRGGTKKYKKMNCSPMVQGKTPVSESCYTKDTLIKIRDAYNGQHSVNKITIDTPHLLWLELKKRLTHCEKEDCWLESIKDESLRKKIDGMSFAPDQPEEWKNNPDEWLSNFDILDVLKQYEETYPEFKVIGPTPIDFDSKHSDKQDKCVWQDLCDFSLQHWIDKKKTKIGVVFNLDKHTEDGSHWISLFIDVKENFIFFLDSAGYHMPKEVKAFVDRVVQQGKDLKSPILFKVYENGKFKHQHGDSECGMYCLFFLISMLTKKIGNKTYSHKQLITTFKQKRISDKYIFDYRTIYFNN
jgi:hypothetical protein